MDLSKKQLCVMFVTYLWIFTLTCNIAVHGAGTDVYSDFNDTTTRSPHPTPGDSTIMELRNYTSNSTRCHLHPTDPSTFVHIQNLLTHKTKLIEIELSFRNYTVNPLSVNMTYSYKGWIWSRVGIGHGRTLLSLAFNYGILSLQTLTFGVVLYGVTLRDHPLGCLGELSEDDKVAAVMELAVRDFKMNGHMSLLEGESVCHQILVEKAGWAQFADRCCEKKRGQPGLFCDVDIPNMWLRTLDYILGIIAFVVLLFGPLLTPSWLYSAALDTVPYVVELKEPLLKTMCIVSQGQDQYNITQARTLNLNAANKEEFDECRDFVKTLPFGRVLKIKITEFHILINYRKLLTEHAVPVGMIECLSRSIFQCKIQNVGPFENCCQANIYGQQGSSHMPWIDLCKVIGKVLLVICLPAPFYARVLFYNLFEKQEMQDRHAAVDRLGLMHPYDHKLLQYFTPTHPIFIIVYVIYIGVGITLAFISSKHREGKFQRVLINSARDMFQSSWLSAVSMLTSNFIWPFKQFGMLGLLLGLIYWPIVMSVSLLLCGWYCLPSVYLISRLIINSLNVDGARAYGRHNKILSKIEAFEVDRLYGNKGLAEDDEIYLLGKSTQWLSLKQITIQLLLASVSVITLLAVMVMLAVCISFMVQLAAFTMMGIIVNASSVLKYGSLIFLVVFYSYNCYNSVYQSYLKLNKVIFSEVKDRNRDEVDKFCSLPAELQGNRGFKACEASEQDDYEETDNISKRKPFHWSINDLILFIDSEDNPRVPRELFELVCQIKVSGCPGPVYLSLMNATGKFLGIVLFLIFVCIVVLSFGESYKVSSTNQMLATMAGGFMPFLFRSLLRTRVPEVEARSVSFRGKLEEIIKNFCQDWQMQDLKFELATAEDEKEDDEEDEKKDGDDETDNGLIDTLGVKELQKDDTSSKDKDNKNKDKDTSSKGKDKDGEDKEKKNPKNKSELFKTHKQGDNAAGKSVDILLVVEDEGPVVEYEPQEDQGLITSDRVSIDLTNFTSVGMDSNKNEV